MRQVSELMRWLDRFAPNASAESWDNVGLLVGDPESALERVMTCLTLTPESAAEAIAGKASVIVSHHPVFFKSTKFLRADRYETEQVWKIAREGIGLYSPHTAFDNTHHGINDALAARLGLVDVQPLIPHKSKSLAKVVVYCPPGDRERVLAAAFQAGGGDIGEYSECSFSARGFGTFLGSEQSNPRVGQRGRPETVREWRCELVTPKDRLEGVLRAIRAAHSYEEPAIDVYALEAPWLKQGVGRVGRLPEPTSVGDLSDRIAASVGAAGAQIIGEPDRKIECVAVVCGAGDSMIAQAADAGAELFLTGEVRFHQAVESRARGIQVIAVGHYHSERPAVEDLASAIGRAFPDVRVWPSQAEHDPIAWRSAPKRPSN